MAKLQPVTVANKIWHFKSLIALKKMKADPARHLSKAGVWVLGLLAGRG